MTIVDNTLFENFVTPQICKDLNEAGLAQSTNYQWIITGNKIRIDTDLFDPDDYYNRLKSLLLRTNKSEKIPAYNIKDVEKCLPFFLLTKSENGYEVSLDDIFAIESKKSLRLPDALGALLLEAVKRHVVSLEQINFMLIRQAA
jgi:hypothetical protein